MRFTTSALFLIAAVSRAVTTASSEAEVKPVSLESLYQFEQWVKAHTKQYVSDLQKMTRLHIWLDNNRKSNEMIVLGRVLTVVSLLCETID